jgi:hypothetical protein
MAAPHDLPTAAELVGAVRDWLADEVVPNAAVNTFHARVAANVLAIVARELELGPAQEAAHAARLTRLGVDDDRALADAIRARAIDYRDAAVRALVLESVLDKLAVAHPAYAERAGSGG